MFFFFSKLLPIFVYPLGLSGILILAAIWLRRRVRWQTALLLIAFFALMLGGNRWVATLVLRPLEWQYLPPDPLPEAPVIVLLGGATRALDYPQHQVPGLNESADRLLYAAWLYHQGVAPHILVSGGQGPGSTTVEAEEMGLVLELMDVPPEAIWFEDRSLNTYENGLYTREILEAQGIEEIVLVTSAFHMPRAVAIFEKQELTVIPAPTDYFVVRSDREKMPSVSPAYVLFNLLPDAEYLLMTTRGLKEYFGIVIYGLRGWL